MKTGTPKELTVWLENQDPEKVFTVEEHVPLRSLDQNRLYWKIVTMIADALHMSKPEVHNRLMQDHGRDLDLDIEGPIGKWIEDTAEMEEKILRRADIHMRPTAKVRDGKRLWIMLKASHDMDKKEMNVLIDGAIQEAEQLNIYLEGIT